MSRILPALSVVFCILLTLLGAGVVGMKYVDYRQKENTIKSFIDPYYEALARGCYKQKNTNCCLSSVSNMQSRNTLLIGENGCPL